MSNKVYSGTWHTTLGNNGLSYVEFSVRSVGREMRIKSVGFTLAIYEPGLLQRYDWRAMKSIIYLTVGSGAGQQICQAFNAPTVAPAFMGNFIEIYEPFQYFFDGFFVANELPLALYILNHEGAAREFWTTVTIETEEKTIFR